jgi:hypothetical protein
MEARRRRRVTRKSGGTPYGGVNDHLRGGEAEAA